jgi:hypothetical protein
MTIINLHKSKHGKSAGHMHTWRSMFGSHSVAESTEPGAVQGSLCLLETSIRELRDASRQVIWTLLKVQQLPAGLRS